MPKHDKHDRTERKESQEKRRKHDHVSSDDEDLKRKRKPRQYASDDANSSPETQKSRHRSSESRKRKSRREESPPRERRHRDIKKERHDSDYAEVRTHDRSSRRNVDVTIKREEDFDRRQEELRRRREERMQRHGRPDENVRIKQEYGDNRGHHSNQRMNEERRRNDERRREERERRDRSGDVEQAFESEKEEPPEKEKPNLGLSGALTEDTNTYRGVVIKYNEPPEARIPKKKWRLYPFKGTEALKTLHLHRQSAYLLGRLRRIADISIDHPSCSKQHAVLQFRAIDAEVDGVLRRRVKPYIIDLGAANGTYVNNERIEAQRYVELKEQDVLKFGFSSREYVLLHDKSDTSAVGSGSEEEDED